MKHFARKHRFTFGVLMIAGSPLILGAILLFVIAYTLAVAIDMLAGEP